MKEGGEASLDHTATSELLRLAAAAIIAHHDRNASADLLASELRIRARTLESAAADKGGHESSRRSLLVALGEVRP